MAGGQILAFPIDIDRHPYNTLALPCECVIEKSSYFSTSLTDCHEILHGDALRHCWRVRWLKIRNLKNPTWRRPPSWKIEKSSYQPRNERFQRNMARWRSLKNLLIVPDSPDRKNIKFRKSKMAAAAILKNQTSPYLCRDTIDFDAIWHDDAVWLSWLFRPLQVWNFENPRWRRPPDWKSKNYHILAVVKAILTKFEESTKMEGRV